METERIAKEAEEKAQAAMAKAGTGSKVPIKDDTVRAGKVLKDQEVDATSPDHVHKGKDK